MADPITLTAVITGLVGVFKAYTEYKAAVVKASEKQEAAPPKSAEVTKGEQAAPIIKAAVAQHGEPKDTTVVANFEDDPETYQEALQKMLNRLAERSQPFASQLQRIARDAQIQTGDVQGSVNVSDNAKIQGQAVGVNQGTMTGTFTFGDDEKDEDT
jgi:Na+-transporting methylmalonyl-CoA/oxaloacetate decarboxylase gamma subunit